MREEALAQLESPGSEKVRAQNSFPEHRELAIVIGEALGIYRDCPVSKGYTSPFAPIWIHELVSRQGG